MIQEKRIEEMMKRYESADFEQELNSFQQKYPLLHAYLLNDQLEALSEEEFKLLFFDTMVIVACFEAEGIFPERIDPKTLEEMESANWSLLQNSKPVGFHDKLDIFFRDTRQEDLLAFIEDSLVEDEEMPISSAAREILFICLKSIVDLLDQDSD